MYIEQLELKDYRNYASLQLSFSERVNVIIGMNAQGKTNLVEALLLLAIAKSHRTNYDRELIRFDTNGAKILGKIIKRTQKTTLELLVSTAGKRARINALEQKKLSEFVGELHCVFFAPEDLSIVKGSPGVRRRFIDIELGQLSPMYLHDLSSYQKIMTQRNTYLKQKLKNQQFKTDDPMLDIYDEQLAEVGARIISRRRQFVDKLATIAGPILTSITDGKETLSIRYMNDFEDASDMERIQESYVVMLRRVREKDLFRGQTSVGPHRDDLQFFVNERNAQQFGSQGQQRTVALCLKLAQIDLVYELKQDYPILILDDVLSELDDARQTHLLNAIENRVQTFITTTSIDGIHHDTIRRAQMIRIEEGSVVSVVKDDDVQKGG
ncbi:MAG: DNA replication/repair protein RecF [Bacilli bacterium]